jgi:hypothetical protein
VADDHARLCEFEAPNHGKTIPAGREKNTCPLAVTCCFVPREWRRSASASGLFFFNLKVGPPRRQDSKIAEMVSEVHIISYVRSMQDKHMTLTMSQNGRLRTRFQ